MGVGVSSKAYAAARVAHAAASDTPASAAGHAARAPANLAPVVTLRPRRAPLRRWTSPRKRLFDVIMALGALTVLAPLLTLIWLAVRLGSPGPGLYWSPRVGRDGAVFMMPKFRTMRASAPQIAREGLADADAYVTWLGRVLRRWSIDELPQLWCILIGQMSFVGPRPLLPEDPAQCARADFPDALAVRPGLSGLAQVRGRNFVSPRRKARLDAFYARMRHANLDFEICARTVAVLITGRGFL